MQERTPPLRRSSAPDESSQDVSQNVRTETEPANGEVSATVRARDDGVPDTSVEEAVVPGLVIDDKYEIIGLLGRGGMGSVFLARNRKLDAPVAIKVLRRELARRADGADRLLREARSAAKLSHPNVVRVFDVGTLETGSPFIVMERLVGADLDQVLRERSALPAAEAAGYVAEACRGLAHAHERGFVHRDLKPANLFLCQDEPKPTIKLLDFGVSKPASTSAVEGELTQDGDLLGSPHYMSPEQLRNSRSVDHRTDVWALGVILYRLVTGKHPFRARGLAGLAVAIATDPPRPTDEDGPVLPRALERIVFRCLEKEPQRRYASVKELERALSAFVEHPARTAPWRGAGAILGLSLGLVAAAALGWAFFSRSDEPKPAAAEETSPAPPKAATEEARAIPATPAAEGTSSTPAPAVSSTRAETAPVASTPARAKGRPPLPPTKDSTTARARPAPSSPPASSTPAPGTLILSGNPAVNERE